MSFEELQSQYKFQSVKKLVKVLQNELKDNPQGQQNILQSLQESFKDIQSQASRQQNTETKSDISNIKSQIKQHPLQYPRGKFDIAFAPSKIIFQSNKQEFSVGYSNIQCIAIFDNVPQSPKNKVILFVVLNEAEYILNSNRKYGIIIFEVMGNQMIEVASPINDTQTIKNFQPIVFCQILGQCGVNSDAFISTDTETFLSSKKQNAISTFLKTSRGQLFPLDKAICFLASTPFYIWHDQIECVELMRADGVRATFDFIIHGKKDQIIEFSSIDKDEIQSLYRYIQKVNLRIGDGQIDSSQEEASLHSDSGSSASSGDDISNAQDDQRDGKQAKKDRTVGNSNGRLSHSQHKRKVEGEVQQDAKKQKLDHDLDDESDDSSYRSHKKSSEASDSSDDDDDQSVEVESEDGIHVADLAQDE